jgi:ATP synthase F1 delta subunit
MSDAVARVYAAALFEAADQAGEVERVRAETAEFAAALKESPQLLGALLDPQVGATVKEGVLTGVLTDSSKLTANVVRLMLHKGRLVAFFDMQTEYERLAAEAGHIIDVEVTSAVELEPQDERDVVTKVEKATGRTVRLTKRIDDSIIGGIVLRVGDVVMDASVRARVEQLREQMQRA